MGEAKETVDRIKTAHPDLSANGWKYRAVRTDHEKWREEMTSDDALEQFERAKEYLSARTRRKTIWKGATSYQWKHQAEHYFHARDGRFKNVYISNGMFMVAAIALDFKVKRIPAGPSAFLNISESECYAMRGDGLFLNHHSGKWITFDGAYPGERTA
jgi:hypothetical protein